MDSVKGKILDCTTIFLQVEGEVFGLPKYLLMKSEVFTNSFALPVAHKTSAEEAVESRDGDAQPGGMRAEGLSATNPIVLEGTDINEFGLLFKALSGMGSLNYWEYSVADLLKLLKLSDRFASPDTRQYAILLLDQHPSFVHIQPIDKLALSVEKSVSQWFIAPLTALARQSFFKVIQEHGNSIDVWEIKQLSKLHQSIRRQRRYYASLEAPALPHMSKQQMSHQCHSLWEKEIWNHIIRGLLEADDKLFKDQMKLLVNQARDHAAVSREDGGMCEECFTAYEERLEECGFLSSEENMVNMQVKEAWLLRRW